MERGPSQQADNRLLRTLAFTLTVSVMSATMFTIVLPAIRAEFRLTYAEVSWVTTSYLLIYAIGTVFYGKLADSYKLMHLLTFGLILFAFGSMVGLAAQAYWMVLLARVLQAAGAAVIPATAGIIPVRYVAPERRGRALGIAMSGLAIGGAIGPMVAAMAMNLVHWRWLFCIPLLTLIAIPFYRRYLDNDDDRAAPKIDWLGGGLLAGTAAMLLIAITNESQLAGVGCIVLLLLLILRLRSSPSPFIRLELFRHASFSSTLGIALLTSGIGYALAFLSPLLLTQVSRMAPQSVGFALMPAAVATALLARTAGKLADERGYSYVFYAASCLLMSCFLLLSIYADTSSVYIALFLILGNVGQSFLMIALSGTLSRVLPQEQIGVGMGLLSMLNFISGAVAASLYSIILDRGAGSSWNGVVTTPDAFVFSNLYLTLALLHVMILAFYVMQFGRTGGRGKRSSEANR